MTRYARLVLARMFLRDQQLLAAYGSHKYAG